jgi:hypothetical protein
METTLAPPTTAVVTDRDRLVARLSWASAWAALVLGQLHALARVRTADGAEDLDLVTVRFWAEPLGDLLSPLLTWADPDLVYVTYGKIWLPVFALFTAAAFATYRHRAPVGFEKAAWRVVLVAYVGACLSVAGEYWTQWAGEPTGLLDAVFLASIPLILLTMLGSSALGITLLVKRFRPRTTAVLLACAVPGAVVIPMFTSLGNIALPLAFGWAVAVRRIVAADR